MGRAAIAAQALDRTGAHVAFTSSSDGLAAGDDDDVQNVYVRDVATGAVSLVSRATGAAGEPTHADCADGAISADGTRVAFSCEGPLHPADTNTVSDIYVRDPAAQTTTLVSRASALGPVGDHDSLRPAIDANGGAVAFETEATNLGGGVPLDHANDPSIDADAYRRALSRDATLRRTLKAGSARISFTGRLGKKRLAAGRHRLTLVARDAAGNASRPLTLRFTVVR